jgi:NADH-quinone oxidoreductase subunit N
MAATLSSVAYSVLIAAGVAALALDMFDRRREAVGVVIAGLLVGAACFGWSAVSGVERMWGVVESGGRYGVLGAAVCALAALTVVGGWDRLGADRWGGTIAALVELGALSAAAVLASTNLTLLLVGLEGVAACGYALVAVGGAKGSHEAAMKYFVQGAIATTFLLYTIAVFVGTLSSSGDLRALAAALPSAPNYSVVAFGAVLGLIALAFKTGAAPFHTWVPDAYENAAWDSAGFLASSVKISGVSALVAFATSVSVGRLGIPVAAVTGVIATTSILIGSVGALNQRSYARMLAYGGVAQVGYALIAVAMHDSSAALLFVTTYGVASAGAFVAGAAFLAVFPEWDGSVDGLGGLGHRAPVLGLAASVLMVSLIGIPPVVGFWGKFTVFASALSGGVSALSGGSQTLGMIGLITGTAGVIGSAVSVGYYGRVLRVLYEPSDGAKAETDTSVVSASADGATTQRRGQSAEWAAVALGALSVALGLIPLALGVGWIVDVFR